jgi:hypothetical protein
MPINLASLNITTEKTNNVVVKQLKNNSLSEKNQMAGNEGQNCPCAEENNGAFGSSTVGVLRLNQ